MSPGWSGTDAVSGGKSNYLHVVVPPPRGDDLLVDSAVAEQWRGLGEAERARVSAFLGGGEMPGAIDDVRTLGPLPAEFASDLARGGPVFRAAFPDLRRRVIGVDRSGEAVVAHVRCVGEHSRAFFRLLNPTARAVTFDVVHSIALRAGHVLGHRVAIDVRAIVLQLVEHRVETARQI